MKNYKNKRIKEIKENAGGKKSQIIIFIAQPH